MELEYQDCKKQITEALPHQLLRPIQNLWYNYKAVQIIDTIEFATGFQVQELTVIISLLRWAAN